MIVLTCNLAQNVTCIIARNFLYLSASQTFVLVAVPTTFSSDVLTPAVKLFCENLLK